VDSLETARPLGSVSITETPVSALTFAPGFVSVNVSCEVEPGTIAAGLKAIATAGGACTATLADAVPPVPPSVEVTLPVLLFWFPAATPVTLLIENMQLAPAARVAPDRLTVVPAADAVIVPPPQLPTMLGGVAMTSPDGSESVKPIPWSAVELMFETVN